MNISMLECVQRKMRCFMTEVWKWPTTTQYYYFRGIPAFSDGLKSLALAPWESCNRGAHFVCPCNVRIFVFAGHVFRWSASFQAESHLLRPHALTWLPFTNQNRATCRQWDTWQNTLNLRPTKQENLFLVFLRATVLLNIYKILDLGNWRSGLSHLIPKDLGFCRYLWEIYARLTHSYIRNRGIDVLRFNDFCKPLFSRNLE